MDDDLVFKALADPTRRLLLDRLFERDGRTLTDLESHLEMTRFGVMKHLRILEEAGLVVSRKSGRTRLHYLNPVPVRRIHDRWIGKYTERRAAALSELKTQLEETVTTMTDNALTEQVYQVFIKATPETIWKAITTPEFTARYFHGARIEVTDKTYVSHGPDGDLWGDDKVMEWDPPRRLVHGWRSMYDEELAKEETSRVTWEIEPQDDGTCLLTVVHDRLEGAPKTAASVSGPGWMRVLSGLKTLLETGAPLG
ncbi:MAG TPA: metalloregulator ArsR/SmtB family transcription factor [Actinoallomurus sp.]